MPGNRIARRFGPVATAMTVTAVLVTAPGAPAQAAACRFRVAFVAATAPAPTADRSLLAATAAAAGGSSCVHTVADADATAAAVASADAVVVSSTVDPDAVPDDLAATDRPMVVSEPLLFAALLGNYVTDGVEVPAAGTRLDVRASRLTGRTAPETVEVLASNGPLNRADPTAEVVVGATLPGAAPQVALFAPVFAPDRVAFFAGAGAVLSNAGAALLRSALAWVRSPQPVNDDFVDALEMQVFGFFTGGSVQNATVESGERVPVRSGTLWWRHSATSTATVGLRASPGTVARIGQGDSAATFRPLATSTGEPVFIATQPGQVFVVQVTEQEPGGGTFAMQVFPAPANDRFADAVVLSGLTGVTGGYNVGAGTERWEPAGRDTARRTVWYRWTAAQDTTFTVSALPTWNSLPFSLDAAVVTVFEGTTLRRLTRLGGPAAQVSFAARAGRSYAFAVDSPGGTQGYFEFDWAGSPS